MGGRTGGRIFAAALTMVLATTASAARAQGAPGAGHIRQETRLYSFTYDWPAAAGAIAPLRAWLATDAQHQQRDIAAQAAEGAKDAQANHYPFNGYDRSTSWQVVTDLPGWLSLSGMAEEYTGG
ncbi:MAG TPA: DUF4163 domain-containing protein, partial [Novosphingobium sp.]|nr:DUF4163 domain-containing protein [Novosphingobium sp.]